jgi:CRISPR-associated protein Csb2
MLAFGIRYLNGFVAARTSPDDREAEWPPHPGRVFMALAAAHFQTGAAPGEREALLWLQSLEKDGEPAAPRIIASEAVHRAVVTHFVPVNDHNDGYTIKNKKVVVFQEINQIGLRRERQERTFARAWLNDDTVIMVWSDAEPTEVVGNALNSLCAKVTRIGHSSSLVQMWVAGEDEIGTPNWVPDEDRALIRLRISSPGTLEYLEHRFNGRAVEQYAALKAVAESASDKKSRTDAKKRLKEEFADEPPRQLRPNLSADCGYARPLPPDANTPAVGSVLSPYLVMMRLEWKEGPYRQLDLACVLSVTQRWREALLSHSNDLSASVRRALSGHDSNGLPLQDAHLAFIPAAFVGDTYADGHLLGMGIALPGDISREDRREIMRALGRVRELKLGRLGVWDIDPVMAMRPPLTLRAETWTAHPKGATTWATMTPIVFDQHPKSREKAAYQAEVAAMIVQCCSRIGLPVPHDVIVTPVSAHLGVPSGREFPLLQRKDGTPRRHSHAILRFDDPVCGPVILGAGRYRGYGVCRPLDEPDGEAGA